jgi:hypothetical protein
MDWDYHNRKVLEIRYEEIFGNEIEVFRNIFKHYRFEKQITLKGLQYVEEFSFLKQKELGKVGPKNHLANGDTAQWKWAMPDEIKKLFRDRHQDLLVKLGYEKNDQWCRPSVKSNK